MMTITSMRMTITKKCIQIVAVITTTTIMTILTMIPTQTMT